MQPQLCSRCKKNVAVVFITRMENGKNINEGLCLKCAKNLGLPQVNEMMQRMGITDEDLDNISNEMMSAFGGAENLEGIDAPDGDDEEDGKTATFPFLGRLFGGQNGDAPAPADGAADGPGIRGKSAPFRRSYRRYGIGGFLCIVSVSFSGIFPAVCPLKNRHGITDGDSAGGVFCCSSVSFRGGF